LSGEFFGVDEIAIAIDPHIVQIEHEDEEVFAFVLLLYADVLSVVGVSVDQTWRLFVLEELS
jgi:hypothetical protein